MWGWEASGCPKTAQSAHSAWPRSPVARDEGGQVSQWSGSVFLEHPTHTMLCGVSQGSHKQLSVLPVRRDHGANLQGRARPIRHAPCGRPQPSLARGCHSAANPLPTEPAESPCGRLLERRGHRSSSPSLQDMDIQKFCFEG